MTERARAERWAPLLHSAKTFAGGALALSVGFALGLPRPYWSIITAYVVSQTHAGETRAKGLYRLLGTILGAAGGVAVVLALGAWRWPFAVAMSLWVGLMLHLSMLDRTPRGYVFLLAGFTAAVVAFPALGHPETAEAIGKARLMEIALGVVCATLVHSLVMPRSVSAALMARIDGWLTDAERWTVGVLEGRPRAESAADRRRLITDAAELHLMTTQLPFATSRLRARQALVRALEDRMVFLVPNVSAVEDRLAALASLGEVDDPNVADARCQFAGWLRAVELVHEDDEADVRVAVDRLAADPARTWPGMLKRNLAARLRDILAIHGDSRALAASLRADAPQLPERLDPTVRERARRPLHRDPALAAWSGLAAALGTFACAALWLATGWKDGPTATVYAAIGCTIFATRDDPAPAIATFLLWSLVSFPIAALYIYGVMPHVHSLPVLILALAPALLAMGVLYELPRHSNKAGPLVFGFLGAVAPQPHWQANPTALIHGAVALLAGLAIAIVVTRAMRSMNAERAARRIARLAWRDLAEVAAAGRPPDREPLVGRMLDRLALLTPRVSEARADVASASTLDDLRLVINVANLQVVRAGAAGRTCDATSALLEALAEHFTRIADGGPTAPPPALLSLMDDALWCVVDDPASAPDDVVALVGLRRNLFPAAPGPVRRAAGANP